jgi:NAD-dependent SIR2 family protein deacetylase
MAKLVPRFTLITQNVDGLHQRAGSTDVLELHGNIHRIKCFAENVVVNDWRESLDAPPRCPRCGNWLRPDVVWFGEMLPQGALGAAHAAAAACQVFLSVGTSTYLCPRSLTGAWPLRPVTKAVVIRVHHFLSKYERVQRNTIRPQLSCDEPILRTLNIFKKISSIAPTDQNYFDSPI